jgi:hypothetical protein
MVVSRVNVLSVEWRSGPRRPGLVAAEFFVDGRPLLEYCERATRETFDLVSPFGWTPADRQRALAERLLLRRPPLLPTGRQELLVCPECADLGCGCISAVVQHEEGCYVWSDFGYENNYDPGSLRLFPMGRFTFPERELTRLLGGIVPGLSEPAE